MKILIINYFYPPTIDAHAYRWEQIARLWARNGHHVEVITSKILGEPDRNVEYEVNVTRVGIIRKSNSVKLASRKSLSPIRQLPVRLLNILRPLYRLFYWPDSMWHWIPSLICEIMRRRHGNYDLVISYYPCLGAHIGAAILQRISGGTPFAWVADYGDPFCTSPTMQPNNYCLYDRLNRFIERIIVFSANRVVFTNELTAEAYKQRLGANERIAIIPHLVDVNNNHAGQETHLASADNSYVLYYIGGFHRRIREPDRLFDLIKKLNQSRRGKYYLKIYGPLNGFQKSELSPADCQEITYMGMVERRKALELLKNADIIVNVENDNCIMTPSKVVECISTGRPILNLTNEHTCYAPIQRYAALGYAMSVREKDISGACVVGVATFIEARRGEKSASLHVVREVLESHLIETVATSYMSPGKDL